MGDSFTHSFAPFPDKWGTQIEKLLHYRVLKCGVTGYGTNQELEKAKEIIAKVNHQPQLIIVGYFWNDISDDYSFPNLTVVDGFLVTSPKYKDPKTGELSKRKIGPNIIPCGRSWFSGTYPLSFGEMIRYYLDQHLIVMNLINDALARIFPGKKNAFTDSNKFLAFQDETRTREIWKRHLENLAAFKDLAAANRSQAAGGVDPHQHPGLSLSGGAPGH